jgi:hypothetical protein
MVIRAAVTEDNASELEGTDWSSDEGELEAAHAGGTGMDSVPELAKLRLQNDLRERSERRTPMTKAEMQGKEAKDILWQGSKTNTKEGMQLLASEQDEIDDKLSKTVRSDAQNLELKCALDHKCNRLVKCRLTYSSEIKAFEGWECKVCQLHTCESGSSTKSTMGRSPGCPYSFDQLLPVVAGLTSADANVSNKTVKYVLKTYTSSELSKTLIQRLRVSALDLTFGSVKDVTRGLIPYIMALEECGHYVAVRFFDGGKAFQTVIVKNKKGTY